MSQLTQISALLDSGCWVRFKYNGDKPYEPPKVEGKLGKFSIYYMEGHGYWVVNGPTPLKLAVNINKLFLPNTRQLPTKHVIRVAGMAGGVEDIASYAVWRLPDGSRAEGDASGYHPHLASEAKPFIESYHIDSDAALRFFCGYLIANGLDR